MEVVEDISPQNKGINFHFFHLSYCMATFYYILSLKFQVFHNHSHIPTFPSLDFNFLIDIHLPTKAWRVRVFMDWIESNRIGIWIGWNFTWFNSKKEILTFSSSPNFRIFKSNRPDIWNVKRDISKRFQNNRSKFDQRNPKYIFLD